MKVITLGRLAYRSVWKPRRVLWHVESARDVAECAVFNEHRFQFPEAGYDDEVAAQVGHVAAALAAWGRP